MTLVMLCLARMFLVLRSSEPLQHLHFENNLPQSAPHRLSGGQQGLSAGATLARFLQQLSFGALQLNFGHLETNVTSRKYQ